MEHIEFWGAPSHERFTLAATPAAADNTRLYVAVPPALIVCVLGAPAAISMEKSGATPLPVKLTMWGLMGPESTIVNTPACEPGEVGTKVTLIVQCAPPASDIPQLLLCSKDPVPLILLMVSGAASPLLNTTVSVLLEVSVA